MHGYRTSHGGDLNENKTFKEWKLIIHCYKKLHGGDLNENENYERRYNIYIIYLIFWDGSINVILLLSYT